MTYNPALVQHLILGAFPYSEIPSRVSEANAIAYRNRMREQYTALAKTWDAAKNSEWLLRYYLATKFILVASLFLESARYADSHRLYAARPFLTYYGLFQACRSFILTLPHQGWRDGTLLSLSHEKVTNISTSTLTSLDAELGRTIGRMLTDARTHREMFSYSFPAHGPNSIRDPKPVTITEAISVGTFLAELAQLNSETLDAALITHRPDEARYSQTILEEASRHYTVDGRLVIDREDAYRIDQLMRNQRYPTNLWAQAREGFVEDFFDNWAVGDATGRDLFDPDEAWLLLFPFH